MDPTPLGRVGRVVRTGVVGEGVSYPPAHLHEVALFLVPGVAVPEGARMVSLAPLILCQAPST